jgi:hypothetical protein
MELGYETVEYSEIAELGGVVGPEGELAGDALYIFGTMIGARLFHLGTDIRRHAALVYAQHPPKYRLRFKVEIGVGIKNWWYPVVNIHAEMWWRRTGTTHYSHVFTN